MVSCDHMANTTKIKKRVRQPTVAKIIRVPHATLSESWTGAIGILKRVDVDPLRYQREIRGGWKKRLAKQQRLGVS